MEIDPPIYIPDPSLPKKPIAPLIFQHKKINIDYFDKELYKHKSTIYILTALPFIEDMNSCEKLSIIAHLLAMAADRCTLKKPPSTNYDKETLKKTRYFDKKIKFSKKIADAKRVRILGEFHLLSRKQLLEAGYPKRRLRKLDSYTDKIKKEKC